MHSDKLARWTLLGVQGAVLCELLEEPLYMQSLTVALLDCTHTSVEQARAALWRAVVGMYQQWPLLNDIAPVLQHGTYMLACA